MLKRWGKKQASLKVKKKRGKNIVLTWFNKMITGTEHMFNLQSKYMRLASNPYTKWLKKNLNLNKIIKEKVQEW